MAGATFQALLMIGGVTSTWQTAWTKLYSVNDPGWGGRNLRSFYNASDLLVSGSKVRIRFLSSSSAGCSVDFASMGHAASSGDVYDYDGNQIALTFNGGSAGFTLAAGGVQVSDEMTFAFDKTKNFICAVHITSGNIRVSNALIGPTVTQGWYKTAANEVMTTNVTGYSAPGFHWFIDLIEVYSP